MGIRVNFADVDDAAFDPLPSGVYHVKVTDASIEESGPDAKHPGSEYINWEFTVQRGEYETRRVWTNTITDHGDCGCPNEETFLKGLFALKGLLRATGKWSDEELDADDFNFEVDDVLGSDIKIRVTRRGSEDSQYGIQNVVKKFMTISEDETSSLLPS